MQYEYREKTKNAKKRIIIITGMRVDINKIYCIANMMDLQMVIFYT